MRTYLLIFLCYLLNACNGSTNKKGDIIAGTTCQEDSLSFSLIKYDSACLVSYKLLKEQMSKGQVMFKYVGNNGGFTLLTDTLGSNFKGIFNNTDTEQLDIEGAKYYDINGRNFKVSKFTRNKMVTDGETSYFFTPDIGVFMIRSETWPITEILSPNKTVGVAEYLRLTGLLYKVLTDDDMLHSHNSDNKIKFAPPKFE